MNSRLIFLIVAAGSSALYAQTNPLSGWASLGAMPQPVWDGKTLVCRNGQGALAITPLSDDVMRVRFTRHQQFGRDHSYAVVNRDFGAVSVKTDLQPEVTTLTTASLKVNVQH